MKQKSNVVGYNHDDILLICSNVEQAINHLIVEFGTLNKREKAEVIVMFDGTNTYVEQLLKIINENSKPKKRSGNSKSVEVTNPNI